MFAARKTDNVSSAANYIEDVFSTYLYTGNGTTQTITNGIDLSTYGGLVWVKCRSNATGNHLSDTATGISNYLVSDSTLSQQSGGGVTSANSNGFGLTASGGGVRTNTNGNTYASWTFRKQAKFFDVVTYTGNGVSTRDISHSLGSVPGCIIIKRTDASDDWRVYHRGWGFPGEGGALNLTSGFSSTYKALENVDPTATTFRPATPQTNTNGATYVAYLFAHNAGGFGAAGTDNVISCGGFTATPSDNALVNLGYEPQFVLVKKTTGIENWLTFDSMRGMTMGDDSLLNPNLSAAENNSAGNNYLNPDPLGFRTIGFSGPYIYIAIRRGPMKTPTSGTSVFSVLTRTGNGASNVAVTSGLTTDLSVIKNSNTIRPWDWEDRLRGNGNYISSNDVAAENNSSNTVQFQTNNGVIVGFDSWVNANAQTYVNYGLRRAPGFFDEVCYTGTGSATTFNHNLTVVPELMIVKRRDSAGGWIVYFSGWGDGRRVILQSTSALISADSSIWNNTEPTSTQFTVGTSLSTSSATYVNYLFASCPGVSKVGSYTGNGSSQTINCGFAAGARFILIKRTDSTGDWYVWDTARGIVSGNDPYLLLNSTGAEVTNTDYIDPYSAGFEISSTAPAAINANGGTFIFLAIA